MRTRTLLTPIAALCFFAACKKNNGSNGGGNGGSDLPKVKMYIEETYISPYYNEKDTFNLTYDNNGRLTAMTGVKLKFAYTYNTSTSFMFDLFENGALSIHENLFVKGKYVDSTFQYNNTQDTSTEKYTYNGDLLMSYIQYDYTKAGGAVPSDRHTYTYDASGNMIKDVDDDGSGRVNNTATQTYTDKPLGVRINPTFYPLQWKYLPATRKVVDNLGTVQGIVNYYYTFDNSKRLTREVDSVGGGNYLAKSYIYQ